MEWLFLGMLSGDCDEHTGSNIAETNSVHANKLVFEQVVDMLRLPGSLALR